MSVCEGVAGETRAKGKSVRVSLVCEGVAGGDKGQRQVWFDVSQFVRVLLGRQGPKASRRCRGGAGSGPASSGHSL